MSDDSSSEEEVLLESAFSKKNQKKAPAPKKKAPAPNKKKAAEKAPKQAPARRVSPRKQLPIKGKSATPGPAKNASPRDATPVRNDPPPAANDGGDDEVAPSPCVLSPGVASVAEQGQQKKRGRPTGSKNKNTKPNKKVAKVCANYSDLEDLCLTKASVNCTTSPTKGCNQKADDFWEQVHEAYGQFMEKEDKDLFLLQNRKAASLRERFKRQIQPKVNLLNACYVEIRRQEKSGWTTDDYIKEAMKEYLAKHKQPFPHIDCLATLWTIP